MFAGFRFPREVISVAVRWYLRHGMSCRDAGELLSGRGVTVDHVTVYRCVQNLRRGHYDVATAPRADTGSASPSTTW
jgi:transposase-like protein